MSDAFEDNMMETMPWASEQALRFEPSPRRVRALFADTTIADSKKAMLLHEAKHLPVYYFPVEDVRTDLLVSSEHTTHCPLKGEASYWTISVGDRVAENAVWGYQEPLQGARFLEGYVAFYWNEMDAWYEEDDEVFVHARDPYHRVDVLHSSRHVRVLVGGERIAESRRPRLLFETGLPTRYYLPKLDVRMDLLEPSQTTTGCPYKGRASYYSARVGEVFLPDAAWTYSAPIPECSKIENLVCFFQERVEAVYVDGDAIPRPRTPWT